MGICRTAAAAGEGDGSALALVVCSWAWGLRGYKHTSGRKTGTYPGPTCKELNPTQAEGLPVSYPLIYMLAGRQAFRDPPEHGETCRTYLTGGLQRAEALSRCKRTTSVAPCPIGKCSNVRGVAGVDT